MDGPLKVGVGEMGVTSSVGVGDGCCGMGALEAGVGLAEVGLA